MDPSETPSGRAWLGNFAAPDEAAARLLLDNLRFVSLSRLHRGLKDRLEALAIGGELDTPAVVLPERPLEDLGVPTERRDAAVAYDDFDPEQEIRQTPGSDAFVLGLFRDFVRLDGTRWLPPGGGLAAMRGRQCRSIVVLTDYVGTGDRVVRLATALARNRTIRSWKSLGLVKIHVLSYAASPDAHERVAAEPAIACLWTVESAPTFDTAPWPPDAREAIKDLCRTECRKRPIWALGYKESAGLFATERGAPNNLPAVFWQTTAGWSPLFPERTVPPSVARDLSDHRPSEVLSALAERVGQLRIGRNARMENMRAFSRLLIEALLLLNERTRRPAQLSAELAVDTVAAEEILQVLHTLGLIDAEHRITGAGRLEIDAQKRGLRRSTARLTGTEEVYYPQSLR